MVDQIAVLTPYAMERVALFVGYAMWGLMWAGWVAGFLYRGLRRGGPR